MKAKLGKFSRHDAWVEGHAPKNEKTETEYDKDIKKKIRICENEVEEGKWKPEGRDDILARAIGKAEHPGRVRGVGTHVGITKYFGKTTRRGDASKKLHKIARLMMRMLETGEKSSEKELDMVQEVIKER
ncbi:uncharacterized protein LOC141601086 [Silene latifolia]|uniref:uncharacterized protein LOC141601086 n=1 Tax=Silene latifolia TaxID=37657 RepID=UPI003D78528B